MKYYYLSNQSYKEINVFDNHQMTKITYLDRQL